MAESVILKEFAHIDLTRLYFNDKGIELIQLSRFDPEVSHRLLALGMLRQGFQIEGDGIFTHRKEGDKVAVGICKLCKREFCNGYSGPIETFTWLLWFLTTLFGKVKMMASDKMKGNRYLGFHDVGELYICRQDDDKTHDSRFDV